MSSEKDTPQEPSEPQEKKISVLVLKKSESSLNSAEPFLTSRDWDLQSTTDLKLFLQKLFKNLPNFTMMSIDYPSPKILKLLTVIEVNLKIPVILFSEGSSQKSNMTLRDSAHPYLLYHPLSGPMIERMLLKIQKRQSSEENASAYSSTAIKGGGTSRDKSAWNIGANSSGANASGDNIIYMRSELARQELTQLFKEEGDNSLMGTMPSEETKGTAAFRTDQGTGGAGSNLNTYNPGDPTNPEPPNIQDLSKPKTQTAGLKANLDVTTRKEASLRFKFNSPESDQETEAKINLATASERALVKASKPGQKNDLLLVSNCSRVSCFSVKSPSISGHLVVAFGNDRKMDESFSATLKEFLLQNMAENGEYLTMNDAVAIQLDEVSFDSWSIAEAHFLRKSVHEGTEVAIAFFPQEVADAPLEISAESHMLKMSLEEVRVNQPVEFDLYLYFSANKKYIRYTPQSGLLYSDQKERLQQAGQTQIHMRENSAADVSRYRVQNFLNDIIKNHKASA